MSVLKTNYKDDVINSELAADRKFGEVLNEDGTKSYNDVTPYTQEGDEYGAKEINFENMHTNYAIEAADCTYEGVDLTERFAEEISGYANVWRWIKARIAAGNFDGLHVRDYIPIHVGAHLMKMQIAGINTYKDTCDQRVGNHIDWISKDCYPDTVQWFTSNDNNGTSADPYPWNKSTVKAFLNNTLFPLLPSELREVISNKRFLLEQRYSASGKLTDSTSWGWQDLGKLWLPSEGEVFDQTVWCTRNYGNAHAVQYPIFRNSYKSRIKGVGDGGDRAGWWLLSVCSGYSTYACVVNSNGNASYSNASIAFRVPVCFRIME